MRGCPGPAGVRCPARTPHGKHLPRGSSAAQTCPPLGAQVLILKNFKDMPPNEITVEFWMRSTGGPRQGVAPALEWAGGSMPFAASWGRLQCRARCHSCLPCAAPLPAGCTRAVPKGAALTAASLHVRLQTHAARVCPSATRPRARSTRKRVRLAPALPPCQRCSGACVCARISGLSWWRRCPAARILLF